MPVTVVLPHKPLPLTNDKIPLSSPTADPAHLIGDACSCTSQLSVWAGTWKHVDAKDNIHPSADSFIRGAYEAWARHMHFAIRPDEVWFAILAQLNCYMGNNRNAENLRHLFVAHKGKKKLHVEADPPANPTYLLSLFSGAIQENVKTPWLKDWIMPAFSTTTWNDHITASIMMMGLMKAYFTYSMGITCGIPSVTLLGERHDWELLLDKLRRLPEFGKEPTEYAAKLYHILSWFPRTFDDPESDDIRTFWDRMVYSSRSGDCGGPDVTLAGWIIDFVYWKGNGDKIGYVDIENIPVGYAEVPITWKGGRGDIPLKAAAGGLAKLIRPGAPLSYEATLPPPTHNPAVKEKSRFLDRVNVFKVRVKQPANQDQMPGSHHEPESTDSLDRPISPPDSNPSPSLALPDDISSQMDFTGVSEELLEPPRAPSPPSPPKEPHILHLNRSSPTQSREFLSNDIFNGSPPVHLSIYDPARAPPPPQHLFYGRPRATGRTQVVLVSLDNAQAAWVSEQDVVISCEPLFPLPNTSSDEDEDSLVSKKKKKLAVTANNGRYCLLGTNTIEEHATLQPLAGWMLYRVVGKNEVAKPRAEADELWDTRERLERMLLLAKSANEA